MPDSQPALLPTGYLLQNFEQVADWVIHLYADLLDPREIAFYERFSQLSLAARHLYVRLLSRTQPVIFVQSLQYAEVTNTNAALQELADNGYACFNPELESAALLERVPKQLLLRWFDCGLKSSQRKTELIACILQQESAATIHQRISQAMPFVLALQQDIFQFYLLLFFGNGRQDLSEFVITDLGHVRYEPYRISRDTRYFNCREDALVLQCYLDARDQLEDASLLQTPSALLNLFAKLPHHGGKLEWQRRYERIALAIARQLERLDKLPEALGIYQHLQSHPSRERQARILTKLDQGYEAVALCSTILNTSQQPEELEFAEQYGSKLARKLSHAFPAVQKTHFACDQITLDHTGDAVEVLAAKALTDADYRCFYVENTLFCGLFGLYFWDIVFAPIAGAFFHPFQRGPVHLHSEYFYADRKSLIEQRLTELGGPDWQQRIWHIYESRGGIANPFVYWDALTPELLALALQHIPAVHLEQIFRQLALHPGLFANGFPDLIRFTPQGYELIEVKAPNDRLQPNQRRWFRRFASAGIPVRLLNVIWHHRADD